MNSKIVSRREKLMGKFVEILLLEELKLKEPELLIIMKEKK